MVLTKSQLLRSVEDAAYSLKRTVKTCTASDDFSGLPDAFPVVANRVPVLVKVLESAEAYIAGLQETKEVNEQYQPVGELAKACRHQAGYLQDIFSAVMEPNNAVPKLERYRQAVTDGEGTRIETVLNDLLQKAIRIMAPPLISDELVKELQESFEDVSKLKPSLKDDPKGPVTLNNYSSGSQFFHGGKGDQNHCSGGIMITGPGAKNHISPENKGGELEDK